MGRAADGRQGARNVIDLTTGPPDRGAVPPTAVKYGQQRHPVTALERLEHLERLHEEAQQRDTLRKRFLGGSATEQAPFDPLLRVKIPKLHAAASAFSSSSGSGSGGVAPARVGGDDGRKKINDVLMAGAKALAVKEYRQNNRDWEWKLQLKQLREAKAAARAAAAAKGSSGGSQFIAAATVLGGESFDEDAYDGDEISPTATGAAAGLAAVEVKRGSGLRAPSIRELLRSSGPSSSVAAAAAAAGSESQRNGKQQPQQLQESVRLLLKQQQQQQGGMFRCGTALRGKTIAEAIKEISIDPMIRQLLRFDLNALCRESGNTSAAAASSAQTAGVGAGGSSKAMTNLDLKQVPVRFVLERDYLEAFAPLLLEEAKASIAVDMQTLGSNDRRSMRQNRNNRSNYSNENRSNSSSNSSSSGKCGVTTVRCILSNPRSGHEKLKEVHVRRVKGRNAFGDAGEDLLKDQLLMVFAAPPQLGQ